MNIIRSIIWYIHFPISMWLISPKLRKLEKQKDTMPRPEFYQQVSDIMQKWAVTQLKYGGVTCTITGLEHLIYDEGVVFMSNHQGNFDTALIMAYIDVPCAYVAKKELKPLLGYSMEVMDAFLMDRDDLKQSAKVILDGAKQVKSGYSIHIYPEGTRGKDKTLGEFKAGSFSLATKSNAPIIPITINNTYDAMEKHHGIVTPTHTELHIHSPVYTANLTREQKKELPDKVKNIIASKLIID